MDFSEYLHSIWNVFRKNDMVLWFLFLNSYIVHSFTTNPDVVALIGSCNSFTQENVNIPYFENYNYLLEEKVLKSTEGYGLILHFYFVVLE